MLKVVINRNRNRKPSIGPEMLYIKNDESMEFNKRNVRRQSCCVQRVSIFDKA